MNKLADFLISAGVILIFGLLFLRDRIWGEPSVPTPSKVSLALCAVGFLLTFPISVPCLVLGIILWKLFPIRR